MYETASYLNLKSRSAAAPACCAAAPAAPAAAAAAPPAAAAACPAAAPAVPAAAARCAAAAAPPSCRRMHVSSRLSKCSTWEWEVLAEGCAPSKCGEAGEWVASGNTRLNQCIRCTTIR